MPKQEELHEEAKPSLDERLRAFETVQERTMSGDAHRGLEQGYRFLGEVVGGVLGGAGFGWLIDHFANTRPWGLIGGLLIGTGLSIFVAVKSAAKWSRTELEKAGPLPIVSNDEDEDSKT